VTLLINSIAAPPATNSVEFYRYRHSRRHYHAAISQLPSVNTRGVAHRLKPLGAVLAVGVVPVIEMQLLAVADVAESNQHNSFDHCMPRLRATWLLQRLLLLLLLRLLLLLLLLLLLRRRRRRTFMIWVCVDVGQVAAQLAAALACASRIRGQPTGWNTFSGSMLWCLRAGAVGVGGWGGGGLGGGADQR
jgi:hypothetical protein